MLKERLRIAPMNVSCTNCSAKYSLPDDRVRGKKVRIKCKRCEAAIFIDGTLLPARHGTLTPAPTSTSPTSTSGEIPPSPAEPQYQPPQAEVSPPLAAPHPQYQPPQAEVSPAPAAPHPQYQPPQAEVSPAPAAPHPQYQPPQPPIAEAATEPENQPPSAAPSPAAVLEDSLWTVALSEEDHIERSTPEVVQLYLSGQIDAQTFVWKPDMEDWATLLEVAELNEELSRRQQAVLNEPLAAPSDFADQDAQTVVGASPLEQVPQTTEWREPGSWTPDSLDDERPNFDDVTLAIPAEQANLLAKASTTDLPPPRAAARAPARAKGDLFGGAAQAGSEMEQLGASTRPPKDQRPTGARNDTSVLFSLDALAKTQPAEEAPVRKRQTSASEILLGAQAPESVDHRDDLVNMSAGGLFGGSLSSADLNAPIFQPPEEPPRWKKRLSIGLALLVAIGLAAVAVYLLEPNWLQGVKAELESTLTGVRTTESTQPQPPARDEANRDEAAADGEAKDRVAKAEATTDEAVAPPNDSAAPTDKAEAVATSASSGDRESDGADEEPAQKQPAPTAKTTATGPGKAESRKPEAEPQPAEEPVDQDPSKAATDEKPKAPPFNVQAAAQSLGSAALSTSSCKTPDGPTGTGRVLVTFVPSGRVTVAQVTGALAGTPVGGCVARLFRGARVPEFSGEPTTVAKNFTIK